MSLDDELTNALIDDGYKRAGEEVGYWGARFRQAVLRNGGLSTAKRMLKPRNTSQRAGLDKLIEAGRPDLTLEAIILRPQFRSLFTDEELAIAQQRLGEYGKSIAAYKSAHKNLFPDELKPGQKYVEGTRRQVRVNAYERNPRARKDCIKAYGCNCAVCGFNFELKYGYLGRGFIHVHHLKPLALTDGKYELDPVDDLRPVCPNCHAMLHRPDQMLSIEELKSILQKVSNQKRSGSGV